MARAAVMDGHADVLGMLADPGIMQCAADALAEPFVSAGVTKVAGLEARDSSSRPSWRRGRELTLEVQCAALGSGDCVLLVDDWAETGSQALAARQLVEASGAEYIGLSLLVDQLKDDVRDRLAPVQAVADAAELRWEPTS